MDNYKEVKNYIHNDLGITKEDINNIIVKTVKDEVSKLLKDESFVSSMMKNHIIGLLKDKEYKNPRYRTITDINSFLYDNVLNELCKTVHDNIKIKVGLKTDNINLEQTSDKYNIFEL